LSRWILMRNAARLGLLAAAVATGGTAYQRRVLSRVAELEREVFRRISDNTPRNVASLLREGA
jgi:hypothetical protein